MERGREGERERWTAPRLSMYVGGSWMVVGLFRERVIPGATVGWAPQPRRTLPAAARIGRSAGHDALGRGGAIRCGDAGVQERRRRGTTRTRKEPCAAGMWASLTRPGRVSDALITHSAAAPWQSGRPATYDAAHASAKRRGGVLTENAPHGAGAAAELLERRAQPRRQPRRVVPPHRFLCARVIVAALAAAAATAIIIIITSLSPINPRCEDLPESRSQVTGDQW
jgi:hypothetical protein